MNNEANKNEYSQDPWDEFAQTLRDRTLGPPPSHRGVLLYQCGYAAGSANASRKLQRTTVRLQFVGVAASIIACLAIVSHFLPKNSWGSTQSDVSEVVSTPPVTDQNANRESVWDAWIDRQTTDVVEGPQPTGVLRASFTTLHSLEDNRMEVSPVPVGEREQEKTLRPGDFPLFL